MLRVVVGIGQYAYHSDDHGRSWKRGLREVQPRHAPVVRGEVDVGLLPVSAGETYWDFVTVLPSGFGVATNHEVAGTTSAGAAVFLTKDGGQVWQEQALGDEIVVKQFRRRVVESWPIERFDSLAVPTSGCAVMSWIDPWDCDEVRSYIICSHDFGASWQYQCLGETFPYLAIDNLRNLLGCNNGFFLESCDGGTRWQKRLFSVEWPPGVAHEAAPFLRHVTFLGPDEALALCIHWRDRPGGPPPDVGLLTTSDNGYRWRHLQVFPGPNIGDVNERHILDLHVQSLPDPITEIRA